MSHGKTPRAIDDLDDIYRYTFENFGEAQADKYLTELEAVFDLLADFSNMGPRYRGRTRRFLHGKHIILYRTEQGPDLDCPLVVTLEFR